MTMKIKLLILIAAVSVIYSAGWITKGWFEDSKNLAAERAQLILTTLLREDLGQIATNVENQLQGLKASERIIDRGIIREVEKPVYRNVCIPPDGAAFRLLNSIALGETTSESVGESTEDTSSAN